MKCDPFGARQSRTAGFDPARRLRGVAATAGPGVRIKETTPMRRSHVALMALGISWAIFPSSVHAQSVGDVFRKVNPSVVVIRAKGRDVTAAAGGLVRYNETGSGGLISADGKGMTAAPVVKPVDRVTLGLRGGAPRTPP